MQSHQALRRAAKASAAQVRAIVDAAVDAIITIDRRGLIATFNKAAERMFGYRAREVIGKNVKILMPEPYRGEHDGYMANYQRTGERKIIGIGREVAAQRKDGTIFPMELAVSEVRLGDELTFTGIIRDITERKRLEKEILEATEREQRRIGQDLHDGLCQQLTGIAFLMQALQQGLHDEPKSADARRITGLLKEAVHQARTLSHGLYPVSPHSDGLMLALRELAGSIESIFKISCTFACERPVLFADNSAATHVYRIAQEAVQNAIRHGKATAIAIELIPRGKGGWRLVIRDNGTGLPAKNLQPGMGLRTMTHRAQVIGAAFSLEPLPEKQGSRMTLEFSASRKGR